MEVQWRVLVSGGKLRVCKDAEEASREYDAAVAQVVAEGFTRVYETPFSTELTDGHAEGFQTVLAFPDGESRRVYLEACTIRG